MKRFSFIFLLVVVLLLAVVPALGVGENAGFCID